MSQKKRVRIYRAGGQQGAYINPTAQWMMQMGGAPQEMMTPQMQEIQPIQQPGMIDPNMQQPQDIDPQELMQVIMDQREQGAEFEEIVNMLMDTVPGIDDQLLMQVVEQVQLMEQEQGLGEEPPIEDQELDEEELLRKGGSPKQLRKKFVKEYVKGGIAQNAKASEVAGDSAFNLLDFVGRTNKESLLKTKAEQLAESMFPEQSMPAMYRGGIRKAQVGLNNVDKDANEAAEETYTKAQMEAYVKEQIENSQKEYQEQFQKQFQGYPGGYGYGYGVPGGYGYPYGPGMPSPRGGMWDVGGKGYPLFYNAGPGMGYAGVRNPQLGNLMNMFSKDPDKVSYSSNLSAEELKNVLGDDFQGYDREVLDYDKRFLRKPFEKHVRYTINRGTGKPEPITMTSADATTDDNESYFYDKANKKRFNPFNRADRIIRRDERRGNIDSDYVSPPDSKSTSRQEILDLVDPSTFPQETPPIAPMPIFGNLPKRRNYYQKPFDNLGREPLGRDALKLNEPMKNISQMFGFSLFTNPPVKTYYPGGPVEDYLKDEFNKQRKSISSQFFPESSYGFPNPMRNKKIFGFPNYEPLGLEGAEKLLGNPFGQSWEEKYSLLNQESDDQNQKDAYIDEKTEEGQSYIDPSAIYNFGVQAFTNTDRRNNEKRNNLLQYGQMANQPIDTSITNNYLGFNTGQPLDKKLINNQFIPGMAKRGGAMGKYKAGSTYMLEQDVINKIKAAGGIIKFLD